jgi:hypothetical protein
MWCFTGSLEITCVIEVIVEHLNVPFGFRITRTELPDISLIFTELFKYSLIIITLHSKSCTIKKCWVAFLVHESVKFYYITQLGKKNRLCFSVSITSNLLVSISATRLKGALLQILWKRHWKLNVRGLDCNKCSHLLKTLLDEHRNLTCLDMDILFYNHREVSWGVVHYNAVIS